MSGALSAACCSAWSQAWGGQLLPGTLVNALAFGSSSSCSLVRPQGWPGAPSTPAGWRWMTTTAPAGRGRRRARAAGRGAARWRLMPPWAVLGVCAVLAPSACRPSSTAARSARSPPFFMFVGLAAAWNLIGGFAGYACFGQVGFFGLGGYTTAVLMTHLRWSFWLALPRRRSFAGLFARLVGLAAAAPEGALLRGRHARGRRGAARGRHQHAAPDRRRRPASPSRPSATRRPPRGSATTASTCCSWCWPWRSSRPAC